MLGAIHSRRMLCGGHVDHPGSQPASRIGVTEWRHRCARASRAVKRCAGAPGVAPRCLLARPWDRARLRRSRWRDRACRRASAQGVEGHRARARGGAAATRIRTHALRQRILTPRAENVGRAPWGRAWPGVSHELSRAHGSACRGLTIPPRGTWSRVRSRFRWIAFRLFR